MRHNVKRNFYAINMNRLLAEERELLCDVDNFLYPIIGYKSLGDLHKDLEVEISDLSKTRPYEFDSIDGFDATGTPRIYKRTKNIELLGEYISRNQINGPRVILYINTIREHAQPNTAELLTAEVYVHEMMHAYFDTSNGHVYEEKVEEPITEFAMLKFFEAFDQSASNPQVLSSALKHVQAKQNSQGINCYGFGYYLYNQMSSTLWRELLYNAKAFDRQRVYRYSTPFRNGTYPFSEENKYAKLLYSVLTNQSFTSFKYSYQSPTSHVRYVPLDCLEQHIIQIIEHECIRLSDIATIQRYDRIKPISASLPAIIFYSRERDTRVGYLSQPQQTKDFPVNSYIITAKSPNNLPYIYACLTCHYIRQYSRLVNYRSWNGISLQEVRDLPIPDLQYYWFDPKDQKQILGLAANVVANNTFQHQFEIEIENALKFDPDEINYLKNRY